MSTLLLDRADLEVRLDGAALAMYVNERRVQTVPVSLLERVVIQGARTRLDSSVLLKLAEAGITTIFVGPRAGRRIAIMLGPAHNEAGIRLAQAIRTADAPFCHAWARQLMLQKLRRQYRLLAKIEQCRPDRRKPLWDARRSIAEALAQVETEPAIEASRLLGLEGSAARAYFAGLSAVFAAELKFTGRNRRPPRDPVNVCLSLGYTLIHFEAVRAAHAAGLDPLLGFYHRPSFGRESLASDLIEPLRPAVDEWVWRSFADGVFRADQFSQDKGACLLGKAGRGHFYARWETFARMPRRWLRRRCRWLARDLRTEGNHWLESAHDDDVEF